MSYIVKSLKFAIKVVTRFKGADLYFSSVMKRDIQIQGDVNDVNIKAIEDEGITFRKSGGGMLVASYEEAGYTVRIMLTS